MRKREREIIQHYVKSIIELANAAQDGNSGFKTETLLVGIKGEARTLLAYATAPSLCAECRGLAIDCKICGGLSYHKKSAEEGVRP